MKMNSLIHPRQLPAGQAQIQLQTGSDDSFDLGKELSVFADEIDFDFIQTG